MATLKFYLTLFMLGLLANSIFCQTEGEEKMEKFQAQKIAFITNKLKLTAKEAQIFWPVYNDYDIRKQLINQNRLKVIVRIQKEGVEISEKESTDLADQYILLQKQEAQLAEEFNTKFKTVLPALKVLKLYQAELQFKRELLKQLKQGKTEKRKLSE